MNPYGPTQFAHAEQSVLVTLVMVLAVLQHVPVATMTPSRFNTFKSKEYVFLQWLKAVCVRGS